MARDLDFLVDVRGPLRKTALTVFEVNTAPRPAEVEPPTPPLAAGIEEDPATGRREAWERWDPATLSSDGDEARRRWLVESSAR